MNDFFTSPYALGFYSASVFTILALLKSFKTGRELARFRRHLSDKLEIEAQTMSKFKGELDSLRKENETLRIKVNALNESPDRKIQRDLEIYARAERRMLLSAPGFGAAWESAKIEAHNELSEEEAGKSAPKRLFSRLFGGGSPALPAREESVKAHVETGNGNGPTI